jgi:acyl carrier protein
MKSESEILSELQTVFDGVFTDESVPLAMDITSDDIAGWDSVAHVGLIVGTEKQFGIMFEPDEIMAMDNVGSLVSAIQSKITDDA